MGGVGAGGDHGADYAGEGAEGVANYATQIRRVTPEQVKTVAGKYLDPAAQRVTIIRGIKK